MDLPTSKIADNYHRVLDRIAAAARSAGREPQEIQLVSVTKYVDSEVIRVLYEIGCRQFGESRPQALWKKAEDLKDLSIDWHMIGHLQTNKARRTVPLTSLIHSGDSLKLLEAVNEEAGKIGRRVDVLCEVNVSGDDNKHGFSNEQLLVSLEAIGQLEHIRVNGLMAMASRAGGADRARQDFEKMQLLREQINEMNLPSISMKELSMGMSGDFEEAIACGATLIRVGSTLFEGV